MDVLQRSESVSVIEYRRVWIPVSGAMDEVNRLAAEGWKVMQILPAANGDMVYMQRGGSGSEPGPKERKAMRPAARSMNDGA